MELVILDAEEVCPISLTQEQRDRMQRQRELALARRKARLAGSPQSALDFGKPAFASSKTGGFAPHGVIDLCNSDDEVAEIKVGIKRPQAPVNTGIPTSSKRSSPVSQRFDNSRNAFPSRNEADVNSSAQGSSVKSEEPPLSSEQLDVLNAVLAKKSVFITGSAGTGKSYVTEHAIRVLQTLYSGGVYVTASTGLAACSLNGTTLHSFAGVGLGNQSKEALAQSVDTWKEKRQRWLNAKALVIDEISMIDAELFDKIDYVGRAVRNCQKPFGGLQLVVSGDFFQLPPVQRGADNKSFAFKAKCWNACFDLQVELTHVFRQREGQFVDMLNEIRRGNCSQEVHQRLLACANGSADMGITPTKLYPLKVDVHRENEERLRALHAQMVTFTAMDSGKLDMLKTGRAESAVTLAVGAQVMLIKNIDTTGGLVNGSRGVVLRFVVPEGDSVDPPRLYGASGWPVVRFLNGRELQIGPEKWSIMDGDREVASRTQVPLILAWALSVHKCQGMTLDCVVTDLSRSFEFGMVYVALSRVRRLSGLTLLGFDPSRIKVHPEVVEFYDQLGKQKKFQL